MTSDPFVINKESWEEAGAVEAHDIRISRFAEEEIYRRYFLKEKKEKTKRVLDLGCGTGRTSVRLRELGFEVEAIDYSSAMIRRARAHETPGLHFDVMDATALAYSDCSFDCALFSFNGLDYIVPDGRRLKALAEIRRVLKTGGMFAFSSHNSCWLPLSLPRARMLVRSLAHGYVAPHRLEFHPYGRLVTRYISPRAQLLQLRLAGFEPLAVISKYGTAPWKIALADPFPTYACKKV